MVLIVSKNCVGVIYQFHGLVSITPQQQGLDRGYALDLPVPEDTQVRTAQVHLRYSLSLLARSPSDGDAQSGLLDLYQMLHLSAVDHNSTKRLGSIDGCERRDSGAVSQPRQAVRHDGVGNGYNGLSI